ncbi:MAG: hypothetical protein DI601_08110 [Azospirillum brasilense]|jgi:hypothetical protein|nr:MAG: hypothetical protein DI601_08110 [Azospirillum brasilense]
MSGLDSNTIPQFPASGCGLYLDLPTSHTARFEALNSAASGALLDPEGALLLLLDGYGIALRFADRGDVLRLVLALLGLHDEMARREAIGTDALAELQRLIDTKATVRDSGNA